MTIQAHQRAGDLLTPEEDPMAITSAPEVPTGHDDGHPPISTGRKIAASAVAALLAAGLLGGGALVIHRELTKDDTVATAPPAQPEVDPAIAQQTAIDTAWAHYQQFVALGNQALNARSMDGINFDQIAEPNLTQTVVGDTVKVLQDNDYTAKAATTVTLLNSLYASTDITLTVCVNETATDYVDASGTSVVSTRTPPFQRTVIVDAGGQGPDGPAWRISQSLSNTDTPC